ncbi:MAG: cell division protein SepF [Candidatus Merdivicinus sp.]|jgi:cell division inhibitor SepF
MGFVGKIKEMFTEYDDEYNDELEDAPEVNEFDQIKRETSNDGYGGYEQPSAPNRSKVVNIHATTQLQVVLVKPERFEDARGIAEHLNAKRTVVLNLESASPELSRRLLDFLSGVAFANHGEVQRVANATFIILPSNVNLMGNLLDELEDSGVYF